MGLLLHDGFCSLFGNNVSLEEKMRQDKKKRIALLGAGEIGSAIKQIARDAGFQVLVRELKYDRLDGESVEALHVCIPYQDRRFIKYVQVAAQVCPPKVVIIHSTVPPGTTREVFENVELPTAHSPVNGDHPNLYSAIKKDFVKYVGGVDKDSSRVAEGHLRELKIKKVKVVDSCLETELGKLVNILGYAWAIVFCKWVARLCEDFGADFRTVYEQFTKSYNQGYEKNRPNVRQPILKPVPGPIGGHCVIPDTELLDKVYKNELTKFILEQNKAYKKEKRR